MPIKPTYPGVYIEELPSGVRTITGVSTSVAAFVDAFPRGLRDEAVQVFNMGDFETEYGGLDRNSPASYAIQQFFQNGGSEAWVVRVAQDGIAATAALGDQAQGGGTAVFEVSAGRRIRGEAAENPGLWGNNLYVEVDYDTADPSSTFNLSVSEIQTVGGRRTTVRTETFRNLTMSENLANSATDVVGEGSRLVQLERAAGPLSRPAATGTLGSTLPVAPVIPASGSTFTVDVNGGVVSATCTLIYAVVPTDYAQLRPYLESALRAAASSASVNALAEPTRSNVRALLSGAVVRLIGRGTGAVPFRFHVLAGRGGSGFTDTDTLALGGATATTLGLDVTPNWQMYKLDGASDGNAISGTNLIGLRGTKTGLFALEDVDLFNILSIPQAAELASADDMRAVYAQAESYCEERRAFVLVDVPKSIDSLDAMQTWLLQNESLRHRNAAVYFPRVLSPDPLNDNRPKSLGASGTIAGLYARTDGSRGVWKAPAGTDARLRNVQALGCILTDAENGALNPLGVNCLRTFPVYSHVSWGARTLDGADAQASEWKYVPVRRLTLFLEESLYRGTKWAVFEPNDEPLWAQLRLNIGAFMHNLFRQGAFQGTSPRDAYLVKCDRETTTQNDIDQGIVNILVAFAPLKPAEFVIIKIQQKAGQIET